MAPSVHTGAPLLQFESPLEPHASAGPVPIRLDVRKGRHVLPGVQPCLEPAPRAGRRAQARQGLQVAATQRDARQDSRQVGVELRASGL